ncbi:hypothetical protein PR048_021524 [Dryococelus australis]|uniref:Uncharacterized protein n=1 Tax=Dryococelus australis TaxID=614101 RepID=A0ABQ9GYJ3_9NEOP|nr:hypothetical protein PR048_021524 [Dryococelus australis]
MNDTTMIAKFSGGSDLISIDAEYRLSCMSACYYRRQSSLQENNINSLDRGQLHGLAFAGLISYAWKNKENNVAMSILSLNYDTEGVQLEKAAEIVRRDIFAHPSWEWHYMSKDAVRMAVPESLRALVEMILAGAATDNDAPHRHDARKDMPVPVYIALELYGKTRKKELIDTTYKLGRTDNIDHNPASTTARGAFHGTAISLMQHAKEGHEGIVRTRPVRNQRIGRMSCTSFFRKRRMCSMWLDGSGWVIALVEEEVTTQGRAESMINVSHIARTRYAHQVTAGVLYSLQNKAYGQCIDSTEDEIPMEFMEWLLWFFSLDRVNYSRWLSVHIKDLILLQEKQPAIKEEFCSGSFVARSWKNYRTVTQNSTALRKWMLASPQVCSLHQKFEEIIGVNHFHEGETPSRQHDDTKSKIVALQKDITSLKTVFERCGNPFLYDSGELYNIATKQVADAAEFYWHKNQHFPPSLANMGCMHTCRKSNLIPTRTSFEDTTAEAGPTVQAVLLDGAAVVNMLNPRSSRTFQDYITYVYQPYLKMTAAHVEGMDVIWDRYLPESLKNAARENRGSGVRTHVAPNTKMPNNSSNFLRDPQNKTEPFHILAKHTLCSAKNEQEL